MHFLHGVSPDGASLAYVGIDRAGGTWGPGRIYTVALDGTGERQLVGGDAPSDGCEYAPDGAWIYFNTEIFSHAPGHAQIARIRPDGRRHPPAHLRRASELVPARVARRSTRVVYVSYPARDYRAPRRPPGAAASWLSTSDWTAPIVFADLLGGQGTINVNSWSPDSRRFAFADYPQEVWPTT